MAHGSALLPAGKAGHRRPTTDFRQVVNAIRYKLRTGCSWRMLPHDFPPWGTVHYYYWSWQQAGIWRNIQNALRSAVRAAAGRRRRRMKAPEPGGSFEPEDP